MTRAGAYDATGGDPSSSALCEELDGTSHAVGRLLARSPAPRRQPTKDVQAFWTRSRYLCPEVLRRRLAEGPRPARRLGPNSDRQLASIQRRLEVRATRRSVAERARSATRELIGCGSSRRAARRLREARPEDDWTKKDHVTMPGPGAHPVAKADHPRPRPPLGDLDKRTRPRAPARRRGAGSPSGCSSGLLPRLSAGRSRVRSSSRCCAMRATIPRDGLDTRAKLATPLPEASALPLGRIGLRGAREHQPDALKWYARRAASTKTSSPGSARGAGSGNWEWFATRSIHAGRMRTSRTGPTVRPAALAQKAGIGSPAYYLRIADQTDFLRAARGREELAYVSDGCLNRSTFRPSGGRRGAPGHGRRARARPDRLGMRNEGVASGSSRALLRRRQAPRAAEFAPAKKIWEPSIRPPIAPCARTTSRCLSDAVREVFTEYAKALRPRRVLDPRSAPGDASSRRALGVRPAA